jgi:hypothetical protein
MLAKPLSRARPAKAAAAMVKAAAAAVACGSRVKRTLQRENLGGGMEYLFPPYSIGGQESAVVNAEKMRGAIWLLRE